MALAMIRQNIKSVTGTHIDNQYKLIRHFEVTPASVHDSQMFPYLVDEANTSKDAWADSAYRSRRTEA
jgi:IS5 family transposase